jgi:hypothetical protein
MYIKVFESRKSARCYMLQHDVSIKGLEHGVLYIHNQDKQSIRIGENELFAIIDNYWKDKLK